MKNLDPLPYICVFNINRALIVIGVYGNNGSDGLLENFIFSFLLYEEDYSKG